MTGTTTYWREAGVLALADTGARGLETLESISAPALGLLGSFWHWVCRNG
jgi:hypothetical protein